MTTSRLAARRLAARLVAAGDHDYTMNMIGHDDILVQYDFIADDFGFLQFFINDSSEIV